MTEEKYWRWSPSTKGFYLLPIHGESIPADSIEISDEERLQLLNAEAAGKMIVLGDLGKPKAVEPQAIPLSRDEQIAALEASITDRRIRDAILTQSGQEWLRNVERQIAALR